MNEITDNELLQVEGGAFRLPMPKIDLLEKFDPTLRCPPPPPPPPKL